MNKPLTDDVPRKPEEGTPSPGKDGSSQALERGYGDEHGGYLVEPTEEEPRRPAHKPGQPAASDSVDPKS